MRRDPPLRTTAASPAVPEQELVQLTDALIEAVRQGRMPDREALLAKYPQHADRLDGLIQAAEMVVDLRVSGSGSGSGSDLSGSVVETEVPKQLGDFEILREIGKGGMGVVYEARQISLQRRVALKILPFASVLDSRQLQRFKNESLAAAQLNHPHIVDVYGVGCERGVHYYAMRLIDGQSLAEILAHLRRANQFERDTETDRRVPHQPEASARDAKHQPEAQARDNGQRPDAPARDGKHEPEASARDAQPTPSLALRASVGPSAETPVLAALSTDRGRRTEYFRTVARIGIEAAEALHHAHEHGVIHRDVKPSNLLIDGRGRVWVADFGLAHIETGAELTLSGELMGTLRYMSPEQASGQRLGIDHRTDVYSLGVTLYELLALRAPFEAPTRSELLRQILFDEPRPPRKVRGDVPVDLETIVLRAISKSAADRYAAALALADDLQRFVAGQAIHARPLRTWERGWRWSQRHPTVFKLILLLLLSLSVGTAVSTAFAIVAFRRNQSLTTANAREHAARVEAESNLMLAEQAVGQFLSETASDEQLQQADFHELRTRLLESAAPFYDQFVQLRPGDTGREVLRAAAHRQLAVIHLETGRHEVARHHCERALSELTELAGQEAMMERARTHSTLGRVLRVASDLDGAREQHNSAITHWKRLVESAPEAELPRSELAQAHNDLGIVLKDLGDMAAARDQLGQSVTLFQQLLADAPADREYEELLARTSADLGSALADSGQSEDACRLLSSAILSLERLCADSPHAWRSRAALAAANTWLGIEHSHAGDQEAARRLLEQALPVHERLAALFPQVPNYRHQLAINVLNLGVLSGADGDQQASREHLEMATALLDDLLADFPDTAPYQASYVVALMNQLPLASLQPDLERRCDDLEVVVARLERLSTGLAYIERQRQSLLGKTVQTLAETARQSGNTVQDQEWLDKALGIAESWAAKDSTCVESCEQLARACFNRALLHLQQQELTPAGARLDQALALRTRLAADSPQTPQYRVQLAQTYNLRGMVLDAAGQRAAACSSLKQAIEIQTQLVRESPDLAECRRDLGGSLCNLAGVLRTEGDLEAALQQYALAEDALELPASQEPPLPHAREFLCNALSGHAETLDDCGRHTEAAQLWGRASALAVAPRQAAHFCRRSAFSLARAGIWTDAIQLAERMAAEGGDDPVALFAAATVMALCARPAAEQGVPAQGDDRNETLSDRGAHGANSPDAPGLPSTTRAEDCGRRAVELLRQLQSGGAFAESENVALLRSNEDLATLRDRPDFLNLMRELEQNATNAEERSTP